MSWCGLPFVNADDLALADDVPVDRGQQLGARQPWLETEVRVERIDDEMIVVRLPRWRRGTAIDGTAESRNALNRTGDLGRHRRRGVDRNPFRQTFRRGRDL